MPPCTLCPWECGVDRSRTPGRCGGGETMRIGAVVVHRGEEPPLVHGAGSGAVFFSGCPLRCHFCQNHQISQAGLGRTVSPPELSVLLQRLQELGCSNLNLVTPTHYTEQILPALELSGTSLPVVLNSSGYESVSTLARWAGHAQIFLLDLKYGDNATGQALSSVSDYWDRAREAITWVWEHVGPLELDREGRATRGLMVRHLLLPGMRSNPFAVFEFLAGLSPQIPVSLMSQYDPGCYRGENPALKARVLPEEYRTALERALALGFETLYVQDIPDAATYTPDFGVPCPFGEGCNLLFEETP